MPEPSVSNDSSDDRLDKPRTGNGNGKAKASKSKDLSHVPCKFFKVGGCTAGDQCPFSHQMPEPGQQKDVCAWFIKGQCKFGHKCALAHILPGQPMSMDRKNKKAAQAAAQQAGGPSLDRDRDRDRDRGRAAGGSGEREAERERDRDRGRKRKAALPVREEPRAAAEQQQQEPTTGTITLPQVSAGSSPPGPTIRIRQPTGHVGMKVSPVSITAPMPAPPVADVDFPFGIPDDLHDTLPASAAAAAAPTAAAAAPRSSSPSPSANATTNPMTIPSHTTTPSKSTLPPRLQTQRRQPSFSSHADPPARSPPGFERPSPLAMPISSAASRIDQQQQPSVISPSRAKRMSGSDYGFGPIGSPSRASFTPQQGTSPPVPLPTRNGVTRVEGFSPGTSPSGAANGFLSTSPFEGDKGLFMSYGSLDRKITAGAGYGFGGREVRQASGLNIIREREQGLGMGMGHRPIDFLNEDSNAVMMEDEGLEELLPEALQHLLNAREHERRKSRTGTRPTLERFPASFPATSSHLDNLRNIWTDSAGPISPPGPQPVPTSSIFDDLPLSPSLLSTSASAHSHSAQQSPNLLSTSNNSTAFLSMHHHTAPRPPIQTLRSYDPHVMLDNRPALSLGPAAAELGTQQQGRRHASRASLDATHRLAPLRDPVIAPEHMPGQSLPQGLAAGLSRLHLVPSQTRRSPTPTPGSTPGGGGLGGAGLDAWGSGVGGGGGGGVGMGMGMSWERGGMGGMGMGMGMGSMSVGRERAEWGGRERETRGLGVGVGAGGGRGRGMRDEEMFDMDEVK